MIVCSTEGTSSPHQGVLLFSSLSVLYVQPNATQASTLLRLELAGIPTAVAHISKAVWAVADSMAGLCLVDLQQACTVCRVTVDIPLTVAHALCALSPGWSNCFTLQLLKMFLPCPVVPVL